MIQSVPFKEKLSYLFARATGQDRIYSHVFQKPFTSIVNSDFRDAYVAPMLALRWLEARPFVGRKNEYEIVLHRCVRHNLLAVSGDKEMRENNFQKESSGSTIFTRNEAVANIRNWEKMMMASKHWTAAAKQPFIGRVETSLTAKAETTPRAAAPAPR